MHWSIKGIFRLAARFGTLNEIQLIDFYSTDRNAPFTFFPFTEIPEKIPAIRLLKKYWLLQVLDAYIPHFVTGALLVLDYFDKNLFRNKFHAQMFCLQSIYTSFFLAFTVALFYENYWIGKSKYHTESRPCNKSIE